MDFPMLHFPDTQTYPMLVNLVTWQGTVSQRKYKMKNLVTRHEEDQQLDTFYKKTTSKLLALMKHQNKISC